jgi:SAM-dependent methyltransferase
MTKKYSAACERNSKPILSVLRRYLAECKSVLEIGSGTGQHAVFFAANLPHLTWQTSDLPANHASINAWRQEAQLSNVPAPLTLDVARGWPNNTFDCVFSANTCHIMSWNQVVLMFEGIGRTLRAGGVLCIYGPFNYGGEFTSASNAHFDAMLRTQNAHMGIRGFESINQLATEQGLSLADDLAMPANNRLLVWRAMPAADA